MTLPTPVAPPAPAQQTPPAASVGILTRIRLTEPVRLYVYSLLLVLTAGLQLAGWLTGQWPEFIATNGAVVLAVGAGAEAARASVYSPRSTLAVIRRATQQ